MTLAGRGLGVAVEAKSWCTLGSRMRGRGQVAVFLPSAAREGAALLRIYGVAEALRRLGWRTLVLHKRLRLSQRRRFLHALRPDMVVMQGSRHELNRPELYPGQRIFYDIDDADFHLDHLAGPVAAAMPQVAGVIAGSRYIADWCRDAGARDARVVWTAAPVSSRPRPPQAGRPPLVAWAQTRPDTYRREHARVVTFMTALVARCPDVRLRLYDRRSGVDEAALLDPFRRAGIAVEWCRPMPYRRYLASFDDVALGLAPLCPDNPFSRGKSFGKILAYLDRTVPVLASDVGEHGRFFTPDTGVITNDPAAWVTAADDLLHDDARRQRMADAAFSRYRDTFSVMTAARRMAHFVGATDKEPRFEFACLETV